MKRATILFYIAAFFTVAQMATAVFIDVRVGGLLALTALICGLLGAIFVYWPMLARRSVALQANLPIEHGPYALVRHPQYLGYMLINVTFILSNPHILSTFFGLASIFSFYLYAGQEEKQLLADRGVAYRAYERRVPGFNVLLGLLRLIEGSDGR